MDHKSIFEQFKVRYVEPGDVFCLSLIPALLLQLRDFGASKSSVTEDFVKDFYEIMLPNEKTAVLTLAVEDFLYYTNSILPNEGASPSMPKVEQIKKETEEPAPTVKTIEVGLSQLPAEEDEDSIDPLHTPEDQMMELDPEDCADAVTDLNFLERINAVGRKQ